MCGKYLSEPSSLFINLSARYWGIFLLALSLPVQMRFVLGFIIREDFAKGELLKHFP
jgi:hypothetical protein